MIRDRFAGAEAKSVRAAKRATRRFRKQRPGGYPAPPSTRSVAEALGSTRNQISNIWKETSFQTPDSFVHQQGQRPTVEPP
jgi:hypothetical protein